MQKATSLDGSVFLCCKLKTLQNEALTGAGLLERRGSGSGRVEVRSSMSLTQLHAAVLN